MDVVYVLGDESRWLDDELRYSLRSLERFASGVDHVFIVGECPKWVQNAVHLPASDLYRHNKEGNILHKLLVAAEFRCISREFLFMNDDHFFLRNINIHDIKFCYDGDLDRGMTTTYDACLLNTKKILQSKGLPTKNFDVHIPTPIDKHFILDIAERFDWKKDLITQGVVVKSMYANTLLIDGELIQDLKINTPMTMEQVEGCVAGRLVFSIGDNASREVKLFLAKTFPKRSRYES
jgi:hypothetical protein